MRRKQKICYTLFLVLALVLTAVYTDAREKKKIALNKKSVTLEVGKTVTLKLKNTKKKAKWCSSKGTIASVSKKGKVMAKKAGQAVITARLGKKKYTCKITVKKKELVVPSFENNTFTKEDYKKQLYVIFPNGKIVLDEVQTSEVYSVFSNLKDVHQWTREELLQAQKEEEGKVSGIFSGCGGFSMSFVYVDGTVKLIRLIGKTMEMNGQYYTLSKDVTSQMMEMQNQYGLYLTTLRK